MGDCWSSICHTLRTAELAPGLGVMRYDRPDVKAVSRLLVVVLAVAVAATPLVLDACLIACTPVTAAVTQSPTADHACHHSDSGARFSLRDAGKRCGHDHGQAGLTAGAVSTIGNAPKVAEALAACVVAVPVLIDSRRALTSRPTISPPMVGSLPSLTLPLRV